MAEKKTDTSLVKMKRDVPAFEGGPVTADVHPEEVESYLAADWRLDEGEPVAKKSSKKAE